MRAPVYVTLFLWVLNDAAAHQFTEEEMASTRQRIRSMFYHAYNSYLDNAFPYDELRPLTCDGQDTWGSFSLTLIDALDTLLVLGNQTEFQRVASLLQDTIDFDTDVNASVFETNIRVVGGLLSAHLLSGRAGMELEPGWPCSGPLLRMAEDAARKLLPAFQTATGMPYGTVNLLKGVSPTETSVTCTAGVGTFILEFATLSRLTGDATFENVARRALRALWKTNDLAALSCSALMFLCPDWPKIKDVRDHQLDNRMESFFLAETVKYLYLLFDPDHFLHGGRASGDSSWEAGGEGGQCVLGAGGFVFNTEAHPLDPAALYCCSQHSRDHQELRDLLFSLSQTSGESDNWGTTADAPPGPPGQSESIALRAGEKRKTPPPLSCPVQPFRARLSLLGQVFTDRS
eukprot:XP_011618915.1 PREDICTED: ER degradation-enhancing alpha-mannosidase-like protein 2 [Takifugu rubripes]